MFIALTTQLTRELAPDGPTGTIEIKFPECSSGNGEKHPCDTSLENRLATVKTNFTEQSLNIDPQFTLSGKNGYQISGFLGPGYGEGSFVEETAFPFDPYILTFTLYNESQQSTYGQILSTFQFTN